MGLLTPEVNGARQELPCLESPEINGARQEVAAVEKYVNGAWQEIWSAIKYMLLLEHTLTYAEAGYWTGGSRKGWGVSCDRNDGGFITVYLEGDFTNPTISFDCDGWCNYESTSGADRYASAGSVSIYTRKKSGTENYTTAISSVNTAEGDIDMLSYSKTFAGEYDRIGYKIDLAAWSGADEGDYCDYNIAIWNFLIDGKECIPSEECTVE